MKNKPLPVLAPAPENSDIAPEVTYDMVRARAAELATAKGLPAQPVSPADWEQARTELAGGPDSDPSAAPSEAAVEFAPVIPSGAPQTPEPASEDENERRECARIVERSVADAERDRILSAARRVEKSDRSES